MVPYIFFICAVWPDRLSAEFAIGRRARTGTLGSYELCWGGDDKDAPAWKKGIGRIIGWIPLIGSLGIASAIPLSSAGCSALWEVL